MEDCHTKPSNLETNGKGGSQVLNHHTSVQYGAQFLSKSSLIRRSSNLQTTKFNKIDKQEIFQLVYRFIGKLVTNSQFIHNIIQDLKFETSDRNISIQKIQNFQSEKQHSSNSISSNGILPNSSSDKSEEQTKVSLPNVQMKATQPQKQKKKQVRQPKISIMVDDFADFGSSNGSKFSCNSIVNISNINFPPHVLTIKMVRRIFQEPEAFLINLALCLMLKFLFYSRVSLTCGNSCWILSIATIIAYKIYYDDPVGGLIQSFSEILQIKCAEIKDLERYFLDQIKFQAVITNEQFHVVLSKVIAP